MKQPFNDAAGLEEQGSQPGSVQPTAGAQQTPLSARDTPTPAPCSHLFLTQAQHRHPSDLENMDLSHRVPVSGPKGSQAVPREGGGCKHGRQEWPLGGLQSDWCPPYLGCAPWLRTAGRKKRDLGGEKSHTQSQAKQEEPRQEGPRRRACCSLCRIRHPGVSRAMLL